MTGFPLFEVDGVYKIYTRGGHEFTVAVTDPSGDSVTGRAVREEDLRTYHPERTTREYVEGQRRIEVNTNAIDVRVYLGPLDYYEEGDDE